MEPIAGMDVALDFEGIMKIGNKRKLKIFACFAILKRHKLHSRPDHIIFRGGIAMSRELKAVAEYILWFAGESGSLITNLKLQKIVYYAQAWFLALYGRPLFNEEIEAWAYGPVIRALYSHYRDYGKGPLPSVEERPLFDDNVIEPHLREVLEVYLPFDAFELQRMTHNEDPWKEARQGLSIDQPSRNIINMDTMRRFYRALVENNA